MDELEFTYWFPKVLHMFGYKKLHFLTEDDDSLPSPLIKYKSYKSLKKVKKFLGTPLKLLGP